MTGANATANAPVADADAVARPPNRTTLLSLWPVAVMLLVCAAVYVPLARTGGTGVRAIFFVLVAYTGWRLGFWFGLAAGIAMAPIIILLSALGGADVLSIVSLGGVVGWLVLILAGATAGRLHDLDCARAAAEAALRAERDYARQKQTEADRAQAETRAVLDASSEVMVLVDPERRFRLVNRVFEEILGIAPDEVLGRDWRELRDIVGRIFADPDAFARIVAGSAADSASRFVVDVRQRWPEQRDLELTSTPVSAGSSGVAAAGEPLGRLYVLRDVTSEREVARLREQQQKSMEADLARAAKLQADLLPQGTPTVPALDFAAQC